MAAASSKDRFAGFGMTRSADPGAEDLVAGGEGGDCRADRLDDAGDVEAGDADLRPPQAGHQADGERRAAHGERIADVQARGAGADEHLVGADRRRRQLAQLEGVGGPVSVLDHGLHRSVCSVWYAYVVNVCHKLMA